MNDELKAIFLPLKPAFIVGFIEMVILLCFTISWQGVYPKTIKVLKLNDKDVFFYATETYQSYVLPIWTWSEVSSYDSGELAYGTNKVAAKTKIKLSLTEYEEYYKGIRTKRDFPNASKDKDCEYKDIIKRQANMKILRKNKVIYDGAFVEDLTNIIGEKGRYFIHIYLKRDSNFGTFIKTHISFNIIVDGGNNE